jgi:hypothetical protein
MTETLDLAAIMAAHEPRTVLLDLAAVNSSTLTMGEVADLAEVLDLDLDEVQGAMAGRRGKVTAARAILALAWVIARRADPELTWAEARTWRVEVTAAAAVDPTPPAPRPVRPRTARKR